MDLFNYKNEISSLLLNRDYEKFTKVHNKIFVPLFNIAFKK